MLFGEITVIYCDNHSKNINIHRMGQMQGFWKPVYVVTIVL
jgi:hypothetical protein